MIPLKSNWQEALIR